MCLGQGGPRVGVAGWLNLVGLETIRVHRHDAPLDATNFKCTADVLRANLLLHGDQLHGRYESSDTILAVGNRKSCRARRDVAPPLTLLQFRTEGDTKGQALIEFSAELKFHYLQVVAESLEKSNPQSHFFEIL